MTTTTWYKNCFKLVSIRTTLTKTKGDIFKLWTQSRLLVPLYFRPNVPKRLQQDSNCESSEEKASALTIKLTSRSKCKQFTTYHLVMGNESNQIHRKPPMKYYFNIPKCISRQLKWARIMGGCHQGSKDGISVCVHLYLKWVCDVNDLTSRWRHSWRRRRSHKSIHF